MGKQNKLNHVAVIMDGNGRWAEAHGVPRADGHFAGARRVVEFINYVKKFGISYMTLYAFSTENWKRSEEEVSGLMELMCQFLDENLELLIREKVRLLATGRVNGLPEKCQIRLNRVTHETSKSYEYTCILALNYGGRLELTDAIRQISSEVCTGKLKIDEIDEACVGRYLYHPEIPDPDLVIRTSGELRLSNFLLWESSYSELYFTPVFWPDFDRTEFKKAVDEFYNRQRRYGGRI